MTNPNVASRTASIDYLAPTMADRSRIVSLLTRAFSAVPTPDLAAMLCDSADVHAVIDFNIERKLGLVAKIRDEIVGICGWRLQRGTPVSGQPVCAQLVLLYVVDEYRRQGIAENLCRHYLTACQDRQYADPTFRLPGSVPTDSLLKKLSFIERYRIFGAPPGLRQAHHMRTDDDARV